MVYGLRTTSGPKYLGMCTYPFLIVQVWVALWGLKGLIFVSRSLNY